MTQAMPYARIVGSGSFLPPRCVSNDELAADLATRNIETSDQWIFERTGIRQRYLAERGVKTSALATEAARRALADALRAGRFPAGISLSTGVGSLS